MDNRSPLGSEQLRWVDIAGDTPSATALTAAEALLGPCRGDVPATVAVLPEFAARISDLAPGLAGAWSALATVGAFDLTVARVLEPHLDALTILDETNSDALSGAAADTWGVYAAEGTGARLAATRSGDGWLLDGIKPWCSLARQLDRALVTAWTGPQTRRLFAVDLRGPAVVAGDEPWVARGLAAVDSPSLTFDQCPATAIGADGWYLDRPGFARGGIGVAAVWFGAAVALGRMLRASAARREFDQLGMMHLGAVDAALHQARCVLADAAVRVDQAPDGGAVVAGHARRTVRSCAEEVMQRVAHATGPAPFVRDEHYAARVADLTVYLRQEHAERDEAVLGTSVAAGRGLVV